MARGVLKVRSILFARETLQLPRCFLRLLRQRPLEIAAASVLPLSLRHLPLALQLLLLSP